MNIQVLATGSTGNAYLVGDGATKLLMECGITWKRLQKACGFGLSDVAACLITHEHGDHAKAVKDVIRNGIDVLCSRGTAEALGIAKSYRCRVLKPREPVSLGTWQIMGLPVEHDAAEPFAYMLRSARTKEILLFVTDAQTMPYGTKGITHLMMEANYSYDYMDIEAAPLNARIMRNHMSIDALEEWLRRADLSELKEIWLLHLSDSRSDEAEFKRRIQAQTGAIVHVA